MSKYCRRVLVKLSNPAWQPSLWLSGSYTPFKHFNSIATHGWRPHSACEIKVTKSPAERLPPGIHTTRAARGCRTLDTQSPALHALASTHIQRHELQQTNQSSFTATLA